MVKISDLRKNSTKKLTLNSGIELEVITSLTIEEQMGIGITDLGDLSKKEQANKVPEIACKLIKSWNITDDEENVLEVNIENFKSLPISFPEMTEILTSCDAFKTGIDEQKKNIGER